MTSYGYTVIDVETTGLSPTTGHRVVEIALVYVSDTGVVQDRWSTLVNPQRDVGRTDIHGITATDVLDAPAFADIAPYVLRAIGGRVVTAHNAAFDLRFLAHEFFRPAMSTWLWSRPGRAWNAARAGRSRCSRRRDSPSRPGTGSASQAR